MYAAYTLRTPKTTVRAYVSLLVLLVMVCLPLIALAQTPVDPTAAITSTSDPVLEYVGNLGPIGALVYAGWLLRGGLALNISINFNDADRDLFRRGVVALEQVADR